VSAASLPALNREEQSQLRNAARLKLARLTTVDAARWRDPTVIALAWQHELGGVCDRLVDSALLGTGLRVTISAPPRHGKSEFTGRAMPVRAYLAAAAKGVKFSILYVTSSSERAEEVSDRVRAAIERIYEETKDEKFAPGPIWKRTSWETKGGLAWTAFGWEARTGGVGANLVIMDDMIGSSQVYRSASKRAQLRRVVQEDILSRLVNGGAALQMETRRGIDDTTAWLLREWPGTWEEHVWKCYDPKRIEAASKARTARAQASNRPPDEVAQASQPREGDAYLWAANYGPAWRKTMPHLTDSSAVWRALYQQEPVPEGGTILQMDWVGDKATYLEPPAAARVRSEFTVIFADLTNTAKSTSDPAAFVVMARRGAYRDVLEVVERRCGYVEQKQILRDLVKTWKPDVVRVERAAGGDQMVADLQAEIAGLDGVFPVGDKVARLLPHLGRFAALQVRTPAVGGERWVGKWREELTAFSGTPGEMDNQVDATSGALTACDLVPTASPKAASAAVRAVWG
jgi:predicted phage terminase large subunit-like protein